MKEKEVMCLATGKTYDLVLETGVTAHPAIRPYPSFTPMYVAPIKKGGTIEFVYPIPTKIECLPDELFLWKEDLEAVGHWERIMAYHQQRKETFGYSKTNTEYRFYVFGEPIPVAQPFVQKGIQIAKRLDIEDIPLGNSSERCGTV